MSQALDRPTATILDAVSMQLDRTFSMLEQAIETCPDELWATKQGGFYYWQQLYHVFAAIDLFIKEPHESPTQHMYDVEVMRLLRHEEATPTPKDLLSVAKAMRAAADTFIATATLEKLSARNESRSQRMGREVNYLESLVMLIGHAFYHVGVCDCTLRNHGYKGFL